jgi:hypothetical protein
MPTLSLLTVVSSTPLNDANGLAQFTMCPFWFSALPSSPMPNFLYRIRSGSVRYALTVPLT